MIRNLSFFSQVLQQLSRNIFSGHVKHCKTERNAKGFTSWTHLVSMLFCHLARAESLREICNGLAGMANKVYEFHLKRMFLYYDYVQIQLSFRSILN